MCEDVDFASCSDEFATQNNNQKEDCELAVYPKYEGFVKLNTKNTQSSWLGFLLVYPTL
jgi:hypothetical protein